MFLSSYTGTPQISHFITNRLNKTMKHRLFRKKLKNSALSLKNLEQYIYDANMKITLCHQKDK